MLNVKFSSGNAISSSKKNTIKYFWCRLKLEIYLKSNEDIVKTGAEI